MLSVTRRWAYTTHFMSVRLSVPRNLSNVYLSTFPFGAQSTGCWLRDSVHRYGRKCSLGREYKGSNSTSDEQRLSVNRIMSSLAAIHSSFV